MSLISAQTIDLHALGFRPRLRGETINPKRNFARGAESGCLAASLRRLSGVGGDTQGPRLGLPMQATSEDRQYDQGAKN